MFISILQNVVIYTFFPADQLQAAFVQVRERQHHPMPASAIFVFEHIRALITANLVAAAGVLAISIGLLRRYNWARIMFMVMLALGIVSHVGGLFWQWSFLRTMFPAPQGPAQFRAVTTAMMMFFSVAIAIAMSGLFGWIIKRLNSPEIKNEFVAPRV